MPDKDKTLLVVDDEAVNRDFLSRRLDRAGYAVEVAADAEQALQLIGSHPIELVLLDSMMPLMSGVELLRLLRATYTPAELPIIMVTALSESEKIAEALNLGANDYITKPVDFQVALARIHSHLNRKRAEDALRESEARYALAARGARDGLWDWDLESKRVYYSPRWKEMLGFTEAEIGEDSEEWLGRVHHGDQQRLEAELRARWEGQDSGEFVSEYRMLHKDGGYRWMLGRGMVQHTAGGRAIRMAGSQTDITQNKAYDPLTRLPNRVMFNDLLAATIEEARKQPRGRFAVFFLDLDRFKNVNDSLGHQAGDQLLIEVAARLRSVVRHPAVRTDTRGEDLLARMGGDEFAILLGNVSDANVARMVAERVLAEIRKPLTLQGREVFTTVSIGIALDREEYTTPAEILRDADTAMYRAKSLGKARAEVFDSAMRACAIARLELESDLPVALERGQFLLHYQPKVRLSDWAITGFEALLRWQHPRRGLIPPVEFIPVAEETGQIIPIGLWVLREACTTMRRWQERFPCDPPLEISVNLSVRQFRDPRLMESVDQVLRETGLPPASLQLEITESVLMEDTEKTIEILDRLKKQGIGLKIDDFGTGYSSLNYLHQLPFNSLKIDRSFVMKLPENDNCLELVKAILSLGESLGMEIVAEGVETEEQARSLTTLGCGFGQGFYFSRPVAAQEAESLVERTLGTKPAS